MELHKGSTVDAEVRDILDDSTVDAEVLRMLHTLGPDADVKRMLDERAITAVVVRYIRGVDRRDIELIRSAFHPDGLIHKGSFDGGPDAFADFFVSNTVPQYHRTMHYIRNIAFDFVDDTAYVETYLEAVHMRSAEDNTVIDWSGGRFINRFEQRDGEWKMAELTYVLEWSDSQTSSGVVAWRGRFEEGITCDVEVPELVPRRSQEA